MLITARAFLNICHQVTPFLSPPATPSVWSLKDSICEIGCIKWEFASLSYCLLFLYISTTYEKSETCGWENKLYFFKFLFNNEKTICFWSYRVVVSIRVATDHMGYLNFLIKNLVSYPHWPLYFYCWMTICGK